MVKLNLERKVNDSFCWYLEEQDPLEIKQLISLTDEGSKNGRIHYQTEKMMQLKRFYETLAPAVIGYVDEHGAILKKEVIGTISVIYAHELNGENPYYFLNNILDLKPRNQEIPFLEVMKKYDSKMKRKSKTKRESKMKKDYTMKRDFLREFYEPGAETIVPPLSHQDIVWYKDKERAAEYLKRNSFVRKKHVALKQHLVREHLLMGKEMMDWKSYFETYINLYPKQPKSEKFRHLTKASVEFPVSYEQAINIMKKKGIPENDAQRFMDENHLKVILGLGSGKFEVYAPAVKAFALLYLNHKTPGAGMNFRNKIDNRMMEWGNRPN